HAFAHIRSSRGKRRRCRQLRERSQGTDREIQNPEVRQSCYRGLNCGSIGGRPPRRTPTRDWRFTESSRREPSDIDGKPEGSGNWRERIKRPTILSCPPTL